MNYEHPFSRVSGYWRVCDIMGVDITEFISYIYIYICYRGFKKNEDFVVFDGRRVHVFEDVFVFDTI